ncbi:MAG TPA: hypothetical protein ENJ43_07840 [Gammaproteobacteria bacterium]|nr:hypothetical protein [Gammaproteobacteria bacterium]
MVNKRSVFALASAAFLLAPAAYAHTFTDALTGGTPSLDMRLRMENVSDDAKPDDANALTLRTRLGYMTQDYAGWKIFGEMTNTSAFGDHDYASPDAKGAMKTTYAKVADPELSRINQAWVSYSGVSDTVFKLGRQRVILDNARFVGNVGWRQTEQVYDALVVANTSLPDTTLIYGFVSRAYNIVGAEVPSQSHVVNISYNGLPFGKITGYAYLLDLQKDSGALDSQTLGLRFGGKQALSDDFNLLYALEFANQGEYADANDGRDANYTKLELGGSFAGVTAKVGQEKLGGDGTYSFQTILATKHAFNGWADKFLTTPANGLVDNYFSIGAKPMGIKLLAVYHTFSADEGGDDYGKELNLLAAKKLGKNYSVGLKYANYEADTHGDDTNKVWLWGQLKF